MLQLILASNSPRRRELLEKAGISFRVFPVKVSENLRNNLNLDAQILELAERKALAAFDQCNHLESLPFLILSADTLVILDGVPLGKPTSVQEAHDFLRRLSGRKHEVKTAVALVEGPNSEPNPRRKTGFLVTTEVWFHKLSDQEISKYIATGEPMDKAGAYGIQGLGKKFVERFDGDFENVVGLPLKQTLQVLQTQFQIFPQKN